MYSLIPLTGAIYFASTGLYVFFKDKKNPANIVFSLLCCVAFFWQITWSLLFQINNPDTAILLAKLGYLLIIFLPTGFYHFLARISNRENEEKWIYCSYLVSTVFAFILLFSDLFFSNYYQYFWGYYPKAGLLHPLHVLQTSIVLTRGLFIAYKAMLVSSAFHKKKLTYCIAGLFVYFLGSLDYLCNYGFEFYPPGIIFITIALGIIAYAMTRFKLLDISVVITRQLASLFTILVITTVYIGGYFTYKNFSVENTNETLSLILNVLFIVIAVPTFTNIRSEIQTIPSRIFPKRYNYNKAVSSLTQMLEKLFTLNKLFDFLENYLSVVMNINLREIYICNHENEKTLIGWDMLNEKITASDIMSLNTLNILKKERHAVVYNTSGHLYQSVFKNHPGGAAILCYESNHLIGVFFIDFPTGLTQFSYKDNRLLDKIAHQVAPVLYRALAHHRVLTYMEKSQKTASLVNLVNEYNQEIKGPLSILNSYAKHPGLANEKVLRELVISQVERASNILASMLQIAHSKREQPFVEINLNDIIRQALKLFPVSHAAVNLKLKKNLPNIHGSQDDLQILFINLFKNTLETLHKAKSSVPVDLNDEITITTRISIKNVHVDLTDSGVGVSEKELSDIWEYGYTRGNTKENTAIGLAVVKKIIEDHDGHIHVLNNPVNGVTFHLSFPITNS